MDRCRQVLRDTRRLSRDAYERWEGFALAKQPLKAGKANLDGSTPRPTIAASTTVQTIRFAERQRLRATFDSPAYRSLRIAAERQIGATLDFADLPPDEQALKAGRPVVRLVTLAGNGVVPQGFATGFLVAPDVILTNFHVFRTASEAENCGAQFLYERVERGVREGLIFELDPSRFFISNAKLDYALVAVKPQSLTGAQLSQFQFLPLIAAKGKIQKGNPVNIIQHPAGQAKQYATVNNTLLDLRDDGFLLYETDTLEGSSGSPVFNQWWETIGLHHCGVPQMEDGKLVTRSGARVAIDSDVDDDDLIWIANEGVRVSALVESFAKQRVDGAERTAILTRLVESTFDMLKVVAEKSPIALAATPSIEPGSAGREPAAAMNTFQFSGPVTIIVGDRSAQLAVPAPSGLAMAHVGVAPVPTPAGPDAVRVAMPEKTLRFDEDYKTRNAQGYDAAFLSGWKVPLPTLAKKHQSKALCKTQGVPWLLKYYHYSLVMHEARRLLIWAASNVDYSASARKHSRTRKEYGGENWRLDPRVALQAPGLQIENADFYDPAKKIDRGHIVRREDACWGATAKEAEFGNSDTYHWTNCTPQSEAFNQSGKSGIWGKFEEHIQKQSKAADGRLSVMSGPVLSSDDPEYGYEDGPMIRVPMEFWKIVLCVSEGDEGPERLAYGFIFDQTEAIERLGYERLDMDDYEISQRPIAEISKRAGVEFHKSIRDADVLAAGGANERLGKSGGIRIKNLQDVVLR